MLTLLRQRNFALLWFGGLISLAGNWMLSIALPVHVYQLTGSTLATGITFVARTLPNIALASLAGVFVDRWDRRRTMIVTNLLLALSLLPLLLVHSPDMVWIVYIAVFVQATIAQFFGPAENALLPLLVGQDQLMPAHALNSLNNNLARLIGPALGGLVAGLVGLTGVVIADAATYLIAAAMIAAMRQIPASVPEPSDEQRSEPVTTWAAIWRDLREGLLLVARSRVLIVLFVMTGLMAIGEGIMSVLFVPFVTRALRGEALQIGWLMSAQAIGGLIGSALIGAVTARVAPARLIGPSMVLFGLVDLIMFVYPVFAPVLWPALLLIIVVGIPSVGAMTSFNTLMTISVADRFRGRIFGAYSTLFGLITLGGMLIGSMLGDLIGVVPVISVQGVVYMLAGLLALVLPRLGAAVGAQADRADLRTTAAS